MENQLSPKTRIFGGPKVVKKVYAKRVGFVNKGNTCYANSILQALSVLPSVSAHATSESDFVCPLVQSLSSNMSLLRRSATDIDPSNFLRALQNDMRESLPPFDFNKPQDACEVLVHVLAALAGSSHVLLNLFSMKISSTITCELCGCHETEEECLNVLDLPVKPKLSSALSERMKSVNIVKGCANCDAQTSFVKHPQMLSCGSVVIFNMERFSHRNGQIIRNPSLVDCLDDISMPVSPSLDDSMVVSFKNNYSLVATINHSGTLSNGHYTAFIKDPSSRRWLHCNDRCVTFCETDKVVNATSYVLFYLRS